MFSRQEAGLPPYFTFKPMMKFTAAAKETLICVTETKMNLGPAALSVVAAFIIRSFTSGFSVKLCLAQM